MLCTTTVASRYTGRSGDRQGHPDVGTLERPPSGRGLEARRPGDLQAQNPEALLHVERYLLYLRLPVAANASHLSATLPRCSRAELDSKKLMMKVVDRQEMETKGVPRPAMILAPAISAVEACSNYTLGMPAIPAFSGTQGTPGPCRGLPGTALGCLGPQGSCQCTTCTWVPRYDTACACSALVLWYGLDLQSSVLSVPYASVNCQSPIQLLSASCLLPFCHPSHLSSILLSWQASTAVVPS